MLETVHPDGRRDEGGMGGPALYPGELLNVYTGRADQGLLRVIVRADPRVRRLRCQSEMGESCGILPSGDDPCVGVVLCPLDSGGTVSVAHGAGRAPVSDDVAARLAEVAARVAARHEDPNPASAAAVTTTRNKALEVLAAYGPQTIPGEPGNVPVYAVVMTGSFTSPRTAPPNPSRPVPRPVTGVLPAHCRGGRNAAGA